MTDQPTRHRPVRAGARTAARAMRREPTDAERALWFLLRDRRLAGWKMRRQAPLGRYILDFVCFEARLVVEADGGQHCESKSDAARDAWLDAQGFTVVRYWNTDILTNAEGVLTDLIARLSAQTTGDGVSS